MWFPETQWGLILKAGRVWSPATESALGDLCVAYRGSLVAFATMLGHRMEDAEDLTQSFLCKLLQRRTLGRLSRKRGRFRSYLCKAFRNFINSVWAREAAQKRGGPRKESVPLDLIPPTLSDKLHVQCEPAERVFDRQWARLIFERAFAHLEHEYTKSGKAPLFLELKSLMTETPSKELRDTVANRLGITINAMDVQLYRLRNRYREICRELIHATVPSSNQVEDEYRYLVSFREEIKD